MITLSQLKELFDLKSDAFPTVSDFHIELVSIFFDIDPYDVERMSGSELKTKYKQVQTWFSSNVLKSKNSIVVNGITYYKKPLTSLTLGEFIDAEHYLFYDKAKLVPLFYRLKKQVEDNQAEEWEDYDAFIDKRFGLFMNEVSAEDVFGVIDEYIKFRNKIIESNGDSFYQTLEDDDEEVLKSLNAKEKKEYLEAKKKEEQQQQFAWESMIMGLCGNDITKFKEVLSLPVIMVYNVLNMLKLKGN